MSWSVTTLAMVAMLMSSLTVAGLAILGFSGSGSVGSSTNGGASHTSLVADTAGVGSSQLSVTGTAGVLVALPEGATARTLGVVVVGAGTESLLLLVVANKENLPRSSDQEKEKAENEIGRAHV